MGGRTLQGALAVWLAPALAAVLAAAPAQAQPREDPSIEQGRELVEINCGKCHAVEAADASPHEGAPPFRTLSERFPMDALEEAFADGHIYADHPDMPEFIATPEQVDAIIAYIASLQE
ncbi:c-type cytochrome [Hoeflea olei]|uniref:Cytochrome C n=1 Tax=Hoeflea olei TaxID=1480615 RepID=A0A1C1Z074_9HYPH|nr:cytochrome c [Hoeflea olei]OCW59168.1 cytochrome C [Hoeflea olei]